MKISWHKKLSRRLRGQLRRRVLSRFGIGVCAETHHGFFITDPGDFVVSRGLLERGEYDRREIEWLIDVMGPDATTLVVIGVHVGALVVPLARNVERVVGFEPNPPTHKLATLNLRLNGIDNVVLENCAIGMNEGVVSIVANPINTGNATVAAASASDANAIKVIAFDSYCALNGIDSIDLLIIDIEGYELHALRGAERSLQQTRVAYVEYAPEQLRQHGTNPADLVDHLCDRFGFVYLLESDVREFTAADAKAYLKQLPERKGLLLNLLLTKSRLSEAARNRRN